MRYTVTGATNAHAPHRGLRLLGMAVPSLLRRRCHRRLRRCERVLRGLRAAERRLHRGPHRLGDLRVPGAEVVAGAALGDLDGFDPYLQIGCGGDLLALYS